MLLDSENIERQRVHRQHTARRWIREGGVVIAAESARGDQSRLEFSETITAGVPFQVTFNLRELSKACKFLTDYAIYLWNCDQDGDYMLYGARENDSYLSAELQSSSDLPAFRRIAAACYAGRYPNMHIDIYDARHHPSAAADASLLTRMPLPRGVCAAIHQVKGQRLPAVRKARWDS
jgi:protocatechuate 3,4-dioxygenase beta subunit